MADIAVVVTCHPPYLKYLAQTIESIDRQTPGAAERVIAFDDCDPPELPEHWRAISGDWHHPSGGRNAGIAQTASTWVIFWDADDVMADGYLAAMQRAIEIAPPDVAIIYPDLYRCAENLAPQSLWKLPEWDYWQMRVQNCVGTPAAWRRAALEMVGGWPRRAGAFEDYALALDLTAIGWKAVKLDGPPVMMRVHDDSRLDAQSRAGQMSQAVWEARSLAIVTLLAGRTNTFNAWTDFLLHAQLPPKTSLYVVDNSGDADFTARALDECQRIASERGLNLNFASLGRPYVAHADEPYLAIGRHQHVARLYAAVLPRVTEDTLLTLEDDMAPTLDTARHLADELGYGKQVGVVAAAYAMPHNDKEVCAGNGHPGGWGYTPQWSEIPYAPIDMGCVGGGCTLWANWALRNSPIRVQWDQLLGWDATLCLDVRRKGYQVRLHGGVRCGHHIHGNVTPLDRSPVPDEFSQVRT